MKKTINFFKLALILVSSTFLLTGCDPSLDESPRFPLPESLQKKGCVLYYSSSGVSGLYIMDCTDPKITTKTVADLSKGGSTVITVSPSNPIEDAPERPLSAQHPASSASNGAGQKPEHADPADVIEYKGSLYKKLN